VVGLALNLLHLLANILFPYMPETSEGILTQLGQSPDSTGKFDIHIPDVWTADALKPGQKLGEPKLLFSAIPASKLEEWRDAFGGEELKKQKAIEAEKAAAKKAAKEKEKEKKRLKKLAAKAAQGGDGDAVKDLKEVKEAAAAAVAQAGEPAKVADAVEGTTLPVREKKE
jgi:methionyl-tRNA synthetase